MSSAFIQKFMCKVRSSILRNNTCHLQSWTTFYCTSLTAGKWGSCKKHESLVYWKSAKVYMNLWSDLGDGVARGQCDGRNPIHSKWGPFHPGDWLWIGEIKHAFRTNLLFEHPSLSRIHRYLCPWYRHVFRHLCFRSWFGSVEAEFVQVRTAGGKPIVGNATLVGITSKSRYTTEVRHRRNDWSSVACPTGTMPPT